MKTLSCPHCGFSKEIPAERLPKEASQVTCPKCQKPFIFDPQPATEQIKPTEAPPVSTPAAIGNAVITCPHCNSRRQVPKDKVPPRTIKVTCPQCQKVFPFDGAILHSRAAVPGPSQQPILMPQSAPEPGPRPARKQLASIGDLFSRSWQVFIRRILTLIGINLLALLLMGAASLFLASGIQHLPVSFSNNPFIIIPAMILLFVVMLAMFSAIGGAMTYAIVDESIGVRQALGLGIQRWRAFLWVFLLLGFILTGGYLAFLLPGLLFTVWFIFAQFVLAHEEIGGMDALLLSRAYVRGHGWEIGGRLLLLWVVNGLLSCIPFIGPLLSLVLGPFTLIYTYEIYRDLREIKGEIAADCSGGEKAKYLLAGAAGYLLIGIAIFLLLGSTLYHGLNLFRTQMGAGSYQEERITPPVAPRQPQPTTRTPAPVVNNRPNQLILEQTTFAPGAAISLTFAKVQNPALKDRVGLFKVGADNQSFGEARYLARKTEGKLQFTAPQEAGHYEFRLFSNWPEGGSEPISRSQPFSVGSGSTAQTGGEETDSTNSIVVPALGENPGEVMVYVFAINYLGSVRFNGEEIYPIAGERDMSYNYTGSVTLQPGRNRFEVDYKALPDPWMTELKLKVYRYDWNTNQETVLAEWVLNDPQGTKTYEVTLDN